MNYRSRQESRHTAEEKQRAPAPAIEEREISDGGKQIPQRISLLQYARVESPLFGGHLFHGQGSTDAPLSTHDHAEKRAKNQKRKKCGRESGEELHETGKQEVGQQWCSAAVTIGQEAEYQSPEGA